MVHACREKVVVPVRKPYITFQGAGRDVTVIEWHDRASDRGPNGQQLRTYRTASVTVFANYFSARNISFKVYIFTKRCRISISLYTKTIDGLCFVLSFVCRIRHQLRCRECKDGKQRRLGYLVTRRTSADADSTEPKTLFLTTLVAITSKSVTLRVQLTSFLAMVDPCTKYV